MNEQFDLSTPNGRQERGLYDEQTDPFITEELRQRAADYIRDQGFTKIKVIEHESSSPVE